MTGDRRKRVQRPSSEVPQKEAQYTLFELSDWVVYYIDGHTKRKLTGNEIPDQLRPMWFEDSWIYMECELRIAGHAICRAHVDYTFDTDRLSWTVYASELIRGECDWVPAANGAAASFEHGASEALAALQEALVQLLSNVRARRRAMGKAKAAATAAESARRVAGNVLCAACSHQRKDHTLFTSRVQPRESFELYDSAPRVCQETDCECSAFEESCP